MGSVTGLQRHHELVAWDSSGFSVWDKHSLDDSSYYRDYFYGSDSSVVSPGRFLSLSYMLDFSSLKGVSIALLSLGLGGPVWVGTSRGCHEDVIFWITQGLSTWERGGFSSAKGCLPSSKRAINLLNCGKAFLDLKLPKNQDLFVINLNASRALYQTCLVSPPGPLTRLCPRFGKLSVVLLLVLRATRHTGQYFLSPGSCFICFPLSSASMWVSAEGESS